MNAHPSPMPHRLFGDRPEALSAAIEATAFRLVGPHAEGPIRFDSMLEAQAAVVRALAIPCPYHARAGSWCSVQRGESREATRFEVCVTRLAAPAATTARLKQMAAEQKATTRRADTNGSSR